MKTIRVDARDFPKSLDLATGEAYTIIIEVLGVEVAEMEDIHFHHGSAVVLPWRSGENVGTTPAEERMSGLSVIVGALRHAKANPGKKVLLAGHADSSGGADYNRKLSRARAEATQTLLAGDKAGFAKVCAAYQKVEDLQQALAWVADVHDWPCHPGAVDNAMGSKTEAARHAFRKRYNKEFSGSLALDGTTSAADWKAMFDLYELGLADELGDDLKAGRAALTFCDPAILACGEDFAAGAERPEGMRSASDRRVDILFLDPGKPYPDFFSEKPPGVSIYGTQPIVQRKYLQVDAPTRLGLRLVAIQGLYKPGHVADGDVEPKASGYQEGYLSEDDKGRIFVNHLPRTNPNQSWQDAVAKDTQYIVLCAQVDLVQGKPRPDARVEWEWFDPNDTQHPETQKHGARVPDEVDVDNRPRTLANRGTCDYPSAPGADMARFAKCGDFGFSEGATINLCTTQITDGKSHVRLHVSNVAGDNFVVRARIRNVPRLAPGDRKQTGVMTVWKRIDVECVQMAGALPLPVDKVPPYFEPARVQMDFGKASILKGADDKDFLTELDKDEETACARFASAPKQGYFTSEGKPGWFFLGAARRASREFFKIPTAPAPTTPAPKEVTYRAKVEIVEGSDQKWEKVVVGQEVPGEVKTVKVYDKEGGPHGYMGVWKKKVIDGKTHLHLNGLDYQSDFEVPTGETTGLSGEPGKGGAYDKRDWYYLRHRMRLPSGVWQPGGMGFAEEVVVLPRPPGTSETTGLSPSASHNGKEYFAGRLVIFTRAFDAATLDENETIATIVHEFTHAFGYPHKCGYYGWPKPPSFSCAMNYNITWLYVVGTRQLRRFMYGTEAPYLCSKHLAGVREVHLEDNPAIWTWKGKGNG